MNITLGALDSRYNVLLKEWRNDERIYKWCRQYKFITDIDQDNWFQKQNDDPTIQMYGIFGEAKTRIADNILIKDFNLLGVCGLTSIDHVHSRAEFSIYVNPNTHKKGIGAKALTLLIKEGFSTLNLNTIWGETFEGNPASKLFESIGFVKEGVRRNFYYKDGKYIDAILYSITKTDIQ